MDAKKRLNIGIPTRNNATGILRMSRELLAPLKAKYSGCIHFVIRDNTDTASHKGYPYRQIEDALSFCDYKMNNGDIGFARSIREIVSVLNSSEYIWLWSDNDNYDIEVVSKIIDFILIDSNATNLFLLPYSHSYKPSQILPKLNLSSLRHNKSEYLDLQVIETDMQSLKDIDKKIDLCLLSCFIYKHKVINKGVEKIMCDSDYLWPHALYVLSGLDQYSKVSIIKCEPFTIYEDSPNPNVISGVTVDRFIRSKLLEKSLVFGWLGKEKKESIEEIYMQAVRWLGKERLEEIYWSTKYWSSIKILICAVLTGVYYRNLKLILYSMLVWWGSKKLLRRVKMYYLSKGYNKNDETDNI